MPYIDPGFACEPFCDPFRHYGSLTMINGRGGLGRTKEKIMVKMKKGKSSFTCEFPFAYPCYLPLQGRDQLAWTCKEEDRGCLVLLTEDSAMKAFLRAGFPNHEGR